MNQQDLIEAIASALTISVEEVKPDSSTENLDAWDSLGHIAILSELDERTGGKSVDLVDLTQATSVVALAKVLTENGLMSS